MMKQPNGTFGLTLENMDDKRNMKQLKQNKIKINNKNVLYLETK